MFGGHEAMATTVSRVLLSFFNLLVEQINVLTKVGQRLDGYSSFLAGTKPLCLHKRRKAQNLLKFRRLNVEDMNNLLNQININLRLKTFLGKKAEKCVSQ